MQTVPASAPDGLKTFILRLLSVQFFHLQVKEFLKDPSKFAAAVAASAPAAEETKEEEKKQESESEEEDDDMGFGLFD